MKQVLLLGAIIWLLSGCDRNNDTSPIVSQKSSETRELTLALTSSTDSAEYSAAMHLASLVNTATQSKVTIKVTRAESSISERELIALVQKGELDMVITPTPKLSHLTPEIQIFDIPFLFEDQAAAGRVYASNAGRTLLATLDSHNLKGLAFWPAGFKQFVTTFPLVSMADFNNRRFRIMESLILREQIELWGGSSVSIASNQLSNAFEKKAIDAAEKTIRNIAALNADGLQITKTNHGFLTLVMMMNPKSFSGLPAQYQDALLEAVKAATQRQFTLVAQEKEASDDMKNTPMTVIQAPNELINQMKEAAKPLLERHRMMFGTTLVEQVLQERDNWESMYPEALLVALDADLQGSAALSGLAIRRGIELAMDEINAQGGLLGKQVKLVARNNSMVPSRGIDNIKTFAKLPNLIAVFSGISSPVVLAELDLIHEKKILMLAPWAAATPIVANNRNPNFVFRVSVRDEYAAEFLLDGALDVSPNIGLMLVNNGWGRSNYEGLLEAMSHRGVSTIAIEWFDWAEGDFASKTNRLIEQGAEVIIYVGNAIEGQKFLSSLIPYPDPPVVISHWGITGSEFAQKAAHAIEKIDLRVLQTFSFLGNDKPLVMSLANRYHQRYNTTSASDIFAPSGTAHAYDLMHLLAQATRQSGEPDMEKIRQEMTKLEQHEGVMKTYKQPFKNGHQDALTSDDYIFAFYQNGSLYPLEFANE
ncbi:TRAP transporter substrate-binding protein DctP [Enterovibrio sp. 27052020O]|uniref:TRAP transporter substrate-binding protein DctP n=1 Tax=Enterovibrio sp. 27052020O TaxID=3241166 RepID=UPI0038910005